MNVFQKNLICFAVFKTPKRAMFTTLKSLYTVQKYWYGIQSADIYIKISAPGILLFRMICG